MTGEIQSIFDEAKKSKVAESKGLQLVGVIDTELRDFKHVLAHGINGMSRLAEGQDFPLVSTSEGDSITYTQNHYGAMVAITKDMRKFWRESNGNVYERVKNITSTVFDQIDQSIADRLVYGFGTTYTDVYGTNVTSAVCPDGKALFAANHDTKLNPTNTFSNIITTLSSGATNPVLSRQAIIDARIRASTFIDANGVMRDVTLDTLIVPPHLLDEAERIVYSNGYARTTGTGANADNFAPNDINKTSLLGNLRIVSWNRLYKPAVAYSDTMWFLANGEMLKESVKALFSQRPQLNAPEKVYENENWNYSIDCYYTLGNGYPAYIYASKGDNS